MVAAHPFFPGTYCLGRQLLKEIDLFDAIEFSHFYSNRINFNGLAIRLAKETGLPLLGTSDSHLVRQFGTTWSLIEAEPTVTSVLAAIRKGQVQVVSRPLTHRQLTRIVMELVLGWQWDRARRWLTTPRVRPVKAGTEECLSPRTPEPG